MGTLTTTTSTKQWLSRVDEIRNDLITSTKTGNRVAAAFSMADARAELLESLKDEQVQARLLRITDPDLAMVELVNGPTDQDRVRICAIALLGGLVPGDDQFAIFGGGFDKRERKQRSGKLYIKEKGYKTLFAHLGISPDVVTQHPEYVAFGAGDKKVWRVGGTASCELAGKTYEVQYDGKNALGIPGYETDNVAGVAAKARRRLLQALWAKVSPIVQNELQGDEDEEESEPVTAPAINHQPKASPPAHESLSGRDWAAEIKKHEASSPALRDYMKAIRDAETAKEIDDSVHAAHGDIGKDLHANAIDLIASYASHRKAELAKQKPSPPSESETAPADKSAPPSRKPSTNRTAFTIFRDLVSQCDSFDALESLDADIQSSKEPISDSEKQELKALMVDRADQLHAKADEQEIPF